MEVKQNSSLKKFNCTYFVNHDCMFCENSEKLGKTFLNKGSILTNFVLTKKLNQFLLRTNNNFLLTYRTNDNKNVRKKSLSRSYYDISLFRKQSLKGHGNEVDFLGFLHKSVRHRSLTLHFEPFRFWLRIRGDIRNRKTTSRLSGSCYGELGSRY